ncbi:hypothetical protein GOP47_0020083 [Adiantum capillus-veneris]|uniref:Uncharacterized protein n=1 Tax=Adiantum capillus-veneris TaxID=13818 RepID=A0A9D4UD96_ADICA|nr:hypothetical protein GOP47_0020083 [Adiantum capillus-veneris]
MNTISCIMAHELEVHAMGRWAPWAEPFCPCHEQKQQTSLPATMLRRTYSRKQTLPPFPVGWVYNTASK